MTTKFKVGDKVKIVDIESVSQYEVSVGDVGIVSEDSIAPFVEPKNTKKDWSNDKVAFVESQLEKVDSRGRSVKPKPIKFLVRYERDEDPVEEFETMNQARARVKELLKDEDVKQDSICIYEIKKKYKVEIKETVVIK